jgi:hypothetical protein
MHLAMRLRRPLISIDFKGELLSDAQPRKLMGMSCVSLPRGLQLAADGLGLRRSTSSFRVEKTTT